MNDDDDLERFVEAQASVYPTALAELRAGSKRSHWMWFVLPQLRGLGRSAMATRYGLRGPAEARAYLAHPLLGPRLHECVAALMTHTDRTADRMLGSVDAVKLRSCLTLFAAVDEADDSPFEAALARFYGGKSDPQTLALLAGGPDRSRR